MSNTLEIIELNDEIVEKDKEIERLTKQNKALNEMYELTKKEYIRLNNTIKEVREEIEYFDLQANHLDDNIYLDEKLTNKLLEILDRKVNK